MGAKCCVAARGKDLSDDDQFEVSTALWNIRWDNRTRVGDEMGGSTPLPVFHGGGGGAEIGFGAADTVSEGNSDGGSLHVAAQNVVMNSEYGTTDQFTGSNVSLEEENVDLAGALNASDAKPSTYISIPSSSAFSSDPSSSGSRPLPWCPTSSGHAHHYPGYQLSRQVSDRLVPSVASLNENSSPEGKISLMRSISSNSSSLGGSPLDGLSMRAFSELVASYERERWSFDSENQSSKRKLIRSNTQPSSVDIPTCGICSRFLRGRSPWSPQKISSISELSVAAVLVCGHVFHAECLENVTHETDRFEPHCPMCASSEKPASKLSRKAGGKAKVSRTAVADADVDGDPVHERQKRGERGPGMLASSSMKSALSRPFLRRHFSIGSRPMRLVSDNESSRKKGFWARHRRD